MYSSIILRATLNTRQQIRYESITKPILRRPKIAKESPGLFGWSLLVIPISTFGLGTWQVYRKKWKEQLVAELKERTNSDPIKLPHNSTDLSRLEYYPVQVKGRFLHEKELYIGPRSLIKDGDAATESSLFSQSGKGTNGYFVVTPFQLVDRDETILVNRGWVPAKFKNPSTREKGQVAGEVNLVGLVRLQENRPNFMPSNKPNQNSWLYRDVKEMSNSLGTSPIFLDATSGSSIPEGPIGGQTRVTLRNEHLQYVITWYSLSAITSFMWYRHFVMKML